MSSQFPVLLAWAFLGSFLLGLLKTSRWKAILISVIAVWCARLQQSDIDLVTAATIEGYAWFAFLSTAVWFPTAVASAIGSDLGAALLNILSPEKVEESEEPPAESAETPAE